jgi:hypothetical protein
VRGIKWEAFLLSYLAPPPASEKRLRFAGFTERRKTKRQGRGEPLLPFQRKGDCSVKNWGPSPLPPHPLPALAMHF